MAQTELDGLKVAILVTVGFEQVEMTELRKALDDLGCQKALFSTNLYITPKPASQKQP